MTCECGAAKTYKAPPKSTLHSDWCVDSPAFKPKPVVLNPAFTKVTVQGASFPLGVHNILYAGGVFGGSLPAPKRPCEPGCIYNGWADYQITYPNGSSWGQFAGLTKYFCKDCSPPGGHNNLRAGGCTVTKL